MSWCSSPGWWGAVTRRTWTRWFGDHSTKARRECWSSCVFVLRLSSNVWYLMMVQILWSPCPFGDYSGSDRPQLRCFRWDAISWRWPVESPSSWLGEAASFSSPEEQTQHWWRERSSVKIINRGGFFLYFGGRHNLRLIQIFGPLQSIEVNVIKIFWKSGTMSLPIYRVIALKKEEKEREDLEKRDKDEVS